MGNQNTTTYRPLNSKERKKIARYQNSLYYLHYFNILKGIALSRFEWQGMPESVDLDYLSEQLLSKDVSFLFEEGLGEYLALESDPIGSPNVYGKFTDREVIGQNGYTRKVNDKDSVLIRCTLSTYNNRLMTPLEGIQFYAAQLAEIDRGIIQNVKKQKLPWIIAADPKMNITFDNLVEDSEDGVPVITVDPNFEQFVKVLNTHCEFIAPAMFNLKKSVFQEALGFLGVTNTSIEKRERVNAAEIEANDAGTVAQRYMALVPLVRACNKINKMYPDLHVSVRFRDNLTAELDGESDDERGEEDDIERPGE